MIGKSGVPAICLVVRRIEGVRIWDLAVVLSWYSNLPMDFASIPWSRRVQDLRFVIPFRASKSLTLPVKQCDASQNL